MRRFLTRRARRRSTRAAVRSAAARPDRHALKWFAERVPESRRRGEAASARYKKKMVQLRSRVLVREQRRSIPNYTTSFTPQTKKPTGAATRSIFRGRSAGACRPGVQYLHHSQGFGRRMPGRRPAPRRGDFASAVCVDRRGVRVAALRCEGHVVREPRRRRRAQRHRGQGAHPFVGRAAHHRSRTGLRSRATCWQSTTPCSRSAAAEVSVTLNGKSVTDGGDRARQLGGEKLVIGRRRHHTKSTRSRRPRSRRS